MNTTTRVLLIAFLIGHAGCGDGSNPEAEAGTESTETAPPTNRVDLPATVRRNLGITFAKVERRRVEDTTRIPGSFELQPSARREYRMTLPGQVRLLVEQHAVVRPGDPLYRFRSPDWAAYRERIMLGEQAVADSTADLAVAIATRDETEARLDTVRSRIEALAGSDLRQASLETDAAEIAASLPRLHAEITRAETRLAGARDARDHALESASIASGIPIASLSDPQSDDGWIEVTATDEGVVERLAVPDGSYADETALVVSTVDPTQVRFRAEALQSDLTRLAALPAARIVPPLSPGIDAGDGVSADLILGLEADPTRRTIPVLATPAEGRSWIRPGVSAFLEVVVDLEGRPALAVPRASIVQDGLVHVLFRRDPRDPDKVIRLEADLGTDDGRWVVLKSGVALGDEVVLDGAYEIKLASQQNGTVQKGGHFHADGTFHADH